MNKLDLDCVVLEVASRMEKILESELGDEVRQCIKTAVVPRHNPAPPGEADVSADINIVSHRYPERRGFTHGMVLSDNGHTLPVVFRTNLAQDSLRNSVFRSTARLILKLAAEEVIRRNPTIDRETK